MRADLKTQLSRFTPVPSDNQKDQISSRLLQLGAIKREVAERGTPVIPALETLVARLQEYTWTGKLNPLAMIQAKNLVDDYS